MFHLTGKRILCSINGEIYKLASELGIANKKTKSKQIPPSHRRSIQFRIAFSWGSAIGLFTPADYRNKPLRIRTLFILTQPFQITNHMSKEEDKL